MAKSAFRNAQAPDDGMRRDPAGRMLSGYYFVADKQIICGCCNCGPCPDDCAEQQIPDSLSFRAARSNASVLDWLKRYVDYAEFVQAHPGHPRHAELMAYLESATEQASRSVDEAGAGAERRIPLSEAMATAMKVYRGEVAVARALAGEREVGR